MSQILARGSFRFPPIVPVILLLCSCTAREEVIVYCAQDQVYAEQVFRDFERSYGIHVRAKYDSEAVKTVGLANRLLSETNRPQADVFWGNEEMRTRQLAEAGCFRQWIGFGHRSRRMVINSKLLDFQNSPASLWELTNHVWKGRFALAYPQFGSTATHFHALRAYWGEADWTAFCRGLLANKPLLVDGNSSVVKLVAAGKVPLGLTDSDDIMAARREGLPVEALPLDPETLLLPNTAAIVLHAPHPAAAEKLFRYLQSPPVVEFLVSAGALEPGGTGTAKVMQPDWPVILANLQRTTDQLNELFLR